MLRWYVSANPYQLAMCTWLVFFAASVCAPVGLHFIDEYGDASGHVALLARGSVFMIVWLSFMGICDVMSKFNKKTARSSFLMLPASNLEKYLSMLVYVTVFLPVCAFVSIALGDTLRMIFCVWVYGDPWLSSVPEMLSGFLPGSGLVGRLLFIALVVWAHSLYVLGATWLRRYSFVIATVVLVSCYALSLEILIDFFRDSDYYDAFRRMCTVIYFLFAALNYWASYRIFKGFQLVTNKWTNYDVFKR